MNKKFKLSELFEKAELKSIYPKNFKKERDLSNIKTSEFNLPLVNAKHGDNGIMYFGRDTDFQGLEMTLGVISDGAISTGDVNPQPQKTGVLYNAYLIKPKWRNVVRQHLLYTASACKKAIKNKFGYENKAVWDRVKLEEITLPAYITGEIAFDYMTEYIKELEAERIKELEAERIKELEAYLLATGLNDYVLTDDEKKLVDDFKNGTVPWRTFKVDELFEKSTRGKRLKSLDRTNGDLPFVTAGETNNGISAFIGNEVFKFKKNTTTIDMFGSAKYRNYQYGCDDHITVVHTEQLDKHSAIFVTSALDKAAHTGDFDYSRNFYAKDADNLFIKLPVTDSGTPDYKKMSIYLRAIEKLVIKSVVEWKNKKITTTAKIVNEHTS